MRRALVVAAIGEIVTGLALLAVPSVMGLLLLGVDLTGSAVPVARLAGLALVGLGIACWPGPPVLGMLAYGALAAVGLAGLGLMGVADGVLLWPAVVVHLVLAVVLGRGWLVAVGR